MKQNVQQINSRGVVLVQASPVSTIASTYALAWSRAANGTNEMIGFQPVGPDGLAAFLLMENRSYGMIAFTDLDNNGEYNGGEPVAYVRNVSPTPLKDTHARARPLELKLSATNGLPSGQRVVLPRQNEDLGEKLTATLGGIADLKDPRFTAAAGEMGMWKPYDFLQQHGVGVYFLEPYDSRRMPVLLVYGIAGSPQNWRPMLEVLDRRKYQPWFFLYASGFRMDKSANALASAMLMLRQRHGFERLAVVAHSMGGLVARGAIQRAVHEAGTNFIPNFVTISTPWGGQPSAELGVNLLKFPVPSWLDMVPESDYLKTILSQPLPPGTRHDLIFSYKSSGGMGLPDENDGVVGVESQLLPQVQEQAVSVLGLHFDHMDILASPITLRRIKECLSR